MIEKKSREYEIEDVFRTYGVLTREAGFYFYFSRKIRELRESGHEGTARAYASSLRSMQRYLGKKDFPFIKLSSRIISDYRGNCSLRVYAITPLVFICIISRLFSGRDVGRWAWNCLAPFAT
ncbi:phage integrase SAM-like domain-containing protein [Bacteroides fragilis]|nr:phage integrase SAM-like domain-containing protein [Bacteroides fragilis]